MMFIIKKIVAKRNIAGKTPIVTANPFCCFISPSFCDTFLSRGLSIKLPRMTFDQCNCIVGVVINYLSIKYISIHKQYGTAVYDKCSKIVIFLLCYIFIVKEYQCIICIHIVFIIVEKYRAM